ncbi:MAG: hypothetical protein QXJ27_06865 [Thermoplasmata archaeon]
MGYSVAIASAILFISLLLSFSFIYAGVNFSINAVEEGFKENLSLKDTRVHTKISVQSSNLSMPESEIVLLNEGSTEIRTTTLNILVNGHLVTENIVITVEGKTTEFWFPGEILKVQLTNLTHTPEKVKIVTGNGSYILV